MSYFSSLSQRLGDSVKGPPKKEDRFFSWTFFTFPLPWWVILCFFVYAQLKIQDVYLGSSCSILGMSEPLTQTAIKRKFRNISMCTHPDRLRGKLNRPPTQAETKRGEVLFQRASKARDELSEKAKSLEKSREKRRKNREKKGLPPLEDEPFYCVEGDFDKRIYRYFKDTYEYVNVMIQLQIGKEVSSAFTGIEVIYHLLFGIVTEIFNTYKAAFFLENGIMSSLLLLMWTGFVWKMMKSLFTHLWKIGIIRLPFEIVRVICIAPIPTVVRFIFLTPAKIYVFFAHEALAWRKPTEKKEDSPGQEDGADGEDNQEIKKDFYAYQKEVIEAKAGAPAVAGAEGLRQRNKRLAKGKEAERQKESDAKKEKKVVAEQKADKNDPRLQENQDSDEEGEDGMMPDSFLAIIARRVKGREMMCRAIGARNIQTEILIVMTKPILPLIMVILTGQVWSGLVISTLMWEVMRKVPNMYYETLHLMCVFFGFIHTWIGVTPDEVEGRASAGTSHQRLLWEWNYRDCIFLVFIVMTGALSASHSHLGNEPCLTTSFGSGVAFRMLVTTDFIQDFGLVQWFTSLIYDFLNMINIQISTSDEMTTYSGGGIGGCGGGMFDMFVGESHSDYLALAFKIFLLLIPVLNTAQWVVRALKGYNAVRTPKFTLLRRFPRIIARGWLVFFGTIQVLWLTFLSLNDFHGGLVNFWLACLVAMLMESYLTTFDIRGPMRSLMFIFVFATA